MKKWLIGILVFVIVILALCTGSVFYLIHSSFGLKLISAEAQSIAKQQKITLKITDLSGTLSDLHATNISAKGKTFDFKTDHLNLNWSPLALLKWHLRVSNVNAKYLKLKLLPHKASTSASGAFVLPYIYIKKFRLNDFAITFENGKTLFGKIDSTHSSNSTVFNQIKLRYDVLRLHLVKPTILKHTTGTTTWKDLCLMDKLKNEVCLSGYWSATNSWHLSITPNIKNLALIDSFTSSITQTQGSVTGTLTGDMRPSQAAPIFAGKLTLKNGSTLIPVIGDHPTKINATVKPQKGNLELIGEGYIGKGKVVITGALMLKQSAPKLIITLVGTNLNAINIPAAQVTLSPFITYTLQNDVQTFEGTTVITHARINGDKIHQDASNTTDVVFVSPSGKIIPNPGHKFLTNVAVTLGKDVKFKGFGISTKLKGTLVVSSKIDTPLVGNGVWTLYDGKFATHGKSFTIKKSTLTFKQSPLGNPTLDVHAEYNLPPGINDTAGAQNITLGVNVYGTVHTPRLSFYSNPPMSREDILSYIILGVPLNRANANQQSEVSQAALSYALNGGDISILSTIKQKLGIDSVGVGSIDANAPSQLAASTTSDSSQNNTAVFVGKKISDRLYVSYGVGVFNQQQEFRTRFIINKYFQLRTTSSSISNGADLVYTINI